MPEAATTTSDRLSVRRDELERFCRRRHITRLALFGSVLHDDFTEDSDIDVLVEFAPGKTPGFGFVRIQDELSEMLGRAVDLGTFSGLRPLARDEILRSAQVIYEA